MSYVTTMFNPSVAVKLQRSKKDYNFQIVELKYYADYEKLLLSFKEIDFSIQVP